MHQGGGKPTPLGRAIAELGRAAKTLHLLSYVDSDTYRRCVGVHISASAGNVTWFLAQIRGVRD